MLLSVYNIYKRFPLETLIIAAMIAIAVIGVILYVGQLVMIGWIVDFLSGIGVPKFRAKPVPLEYDRAGEIIVVRLRDNVATAAQCLSVERQLKRLIEEQHCDFILDFLAAGNVSRSFRGVMLRSMKAARREAERLGKPYRPLDLPRGDLFAVFADRQRAVEAMSLHGGHGWIVLCCVPVGIRAVSELM